MKKRVSLAEAKERERRLGSADGRDGGGFGGFTGNKELEQEAYRLRQIQIQEDVSESIVFVHDDKGVVVGSLLSFMLCGLSASYHVSFHAYCSMYASHYYNRNERTLILTA